MCIEACGKSGRERCAVPFPASAFAAIIVTAGAVYGRVPSFTIIEPAPGARASHVTGLSADGRVVAGYNEINGDNPASGFTWTALGGRNDFGLAAGPSVYTRPYGISADGTTLVGDYSTSSFGGAFRYRVGGAVEVLPLASGYHSAFAYGTNGDGSVVVGSMNSPSPLRATRWVNGQPQVIGLARPNDIGASFHGISRDGSTYIGISGGSGPNTYEPYTWTQTGGWNQLPVPATVTQPYDAETSGISPDGQQVYGVVSPALGPSLAVLWSNGASAVLRPPQLGASASPSGIFSSGGFVCGSVWTTNASDSRAVIWDLARSTSSYLRDYLSARGLSLPAGWTLLTTGVSDNGQVFAGNARGPANEMRGFVATIPAPSTLTGVVVVVGWISRRRRP